MPDEVRIPETDTEAQQVIARFEDPAVHEAHDKRLAPLLHKAAEEHTEFLRRSLENAYKDGSVYRVR